MSALSPLPPNRFSVDISKVSLFLLNHYHPKQKGRDRAKFFSGHGFDPKNPHELAKALVLHAQTHSLASVSNNGYVDLFVYEGALSGPNGPVSKIRSIWKIENTPGLGEFVSSYRY